MNTPTKKRYAIAFVLVTLLVVLVGGDQALGAMMDGGAKVIGRLHEYSATWIALSIFVPLGAVFFALVKEIMVFVRELDRE